MPKFDEEQLRKVEQFEMSRHNQFTKELARALLELREEKRKSKFVSLSKD